MPARDHIHQAAVQSLVADGWTVIKEQYAILIDKRRLFIDIRAAKPDGTEVIFVEVKGFDADSKVDALAEALGQYSLYLYALDYVGLEIPLFLAVPISAYEGIWREPIGELTRQRGQIKLMVFDPDKTEIVQWIP